MEILKVKVMNREETKHGIETIAEIFSMLLGVTPMIEERLYANKNNEWILKMSVEYDEKGSK